MNPFSSLFYVVILIMSVVVHEVAHGFAAYHEGDDTAFRAGRLTLNPLKHIDLVGSVVLPLALVLTKSPFLFGWAKPVPYNPHNFKHKKRGTLFVASAGVLTNFLIAFIFGIGIRILAHFNIGGAFSAIFNSIVFVNLLLGVFNLLPIPPLYGSR